MVRRTGHDISVYSRICVCLIFLIKLLYTGSSMPIQSARTSAYQGISLAPHICISHHATPSTVYFGVKTGSSQITLDHPLFLYPPSSLTYGDLSCMLSSVSACTCFVHIPMPSCKRLCVINVSCNRFTFCHAHSIVGIYMFFCYLVSILIRFSSSLSGCAPQYHDKSSFLPKVACLFYHLATGLLPVSHLC